MHPLDPQNPRLRKKRIIYESLFVLAGLLGVFFIGLAAYRAPRERAHFVFGIDATYKNLRGEGSWASGTGERRADFLRIDRPLAFNVGFTNVGPGVAVNTSISKSSIIEPDISPLSESDALAQFEKKKTIEPARGGDTFVKGATAFHTAEGTILSPEDYDNLVYGRRVVYLIAELKYEDDSGKHTRQLCKALVPPQPGGILIWGACLGFNGEN